MAQEYAISETTLTSLADAVRKNVGETKLIQTGVGEPEVKISKTTNATSFTEHSGGYGNNKAVYDVVSFPGASKIVVDIAYQTESTNYDYVQIAVGSVSSPPSTYPKYGGTTLTRKELTFENTDTITFYFKSDSSSDAFLGYYAECRAYDEEGNAFRQPIYEEVLNTMTVDTMISTINNLSSSVGKGPLKTVATTIPFNTSILTVNITDDFQLPCFISISAYSSRSSLNTSTTYSEMYYNFIMVNYKDGEDTYDNLEAFTLNCEDLDHSIRIAVPYSTGVGEVVYNATNKTFQIASHRPEYMAGRGSTTQEANAKIYYWPKQ